MLLKRNCKCKKILDKEIIKIRIKLNEFFRKIYKEKFKQQLFNEARKDLQLSHKIQMPLKSKIIPGKLTKLKLKK